MLEITNLRSVQELKNKLENDPVWEQYREMGAQIHQNEKIMALYEEYLRLQKQVVVLEHTAKKAVLLQKEKELKELEDQLYNYPLFNEYIQRQIELEELLQMMAYYIQDQVNNHLKQ